MSGQGNAGAGVANTANGVIAKFHQRELFTALSVFVMLIGILVTAASPAFVWTPFGWLFLLLVPLYVLVMLGVRAFTRKEWRLLGLSLNQVAMVSSIVAGVFVIPVTLFEVLPYAQFLPSGVVGGFVFALIGALGYLFFAAVAPFLAPFKDEFARGTETGAESGAESSTERIAGTGDARASEEPSFLARPGVAPRAADSVASKASSTLSWGRGAGEPDTASGKTSPGGAGNTGVAAAGAASSGGGAAGGGSAVTGAAGGGSAVNSSDSAAQGDRLGAPGGAEQTPTEQRSFAGSAPQDSARESAGSAPREAEPALQEPEETAQEAPQDGQTAFWFAVPETRHIVEPGSGTRVAALEPGMWILALEDRGTSFLVSTENGETGILEDISNVERA